MLKTQIILIQPATKPFPKPPSLTSNVRTPPTCRLSSLSFTQVCNVLQSTRDAAKGLDPMTKAILSIPWGAILATESKLDDQLKLTDMSKVSP